MNNNVVAVKLPSGIKTKLKKACAKNNTPMSAVIRNLIVKHLNDKRTK